MRAEIPGDQAAIEQRTLPLKSVDLRAASQCTCRRLSPKRRGARRVPKLASDVIAEADREGDGE
jgi:hypothetical protein